LTSTWRVGVAALALAGCRSEPTIAAQARSSASTEQQARVPVIAMVRQAEQRRTTDALRDEWSSSRDEAVRIATIRALARIADDAARQPLLAALSDASPPVVSWAAFGLGRSCSAREREITAALALRAASLLSDPSPVSIDVMRSVADALARCASPEAERTLRAWLALDRPIAEASAIALGKLAARRGTLEETTFLALLDAASRSSGELDGALYAFTRVAPPEGALRERALTVAGATATREGVPASFAVRALGRLGETAVRALSEALDSPANSQGARGEIARELARLGVSGQKALERALLKRLPEGAALVDAAAGESDLLLLIVESIETRTAELDGVLERLARLPVPEAPRAARRIIELRCAAARLLAGSATLSSDLAACDPDASGITGKLALLFVLDRGKLTGTRGQRFQALLDDADARVRQAALRLLPAHREVPNAGARIAKALADPAPGVVATAAELLSKHPDRVSVDPEVRPAKASSSVSPHADAPALRPDAAVLTALGPALREAQKSTNVEVHAALLDATAALGVLSLNAELEKACRSDNPTLVERAERARKALSHTAAPCQQKPGANAAPELTRLLDRPARLVFETDAGELTLQLDAELAPVAATRLRELVKSGFFTNLVVHRAVSGFVVQLGDPGGDGYGGAPLPPLRCELSPVPFEPGAVGMALSGRDTGNSQFFVTLGRFPHLDGEYTRVGHAEPGWERLRAGDRILSARVE
jgi:cyclophilin family peptidyl-prolyl cis-trans isomerase/HEAT repeat protein